MLNYFVKKINNKKGFTLVELVVVIAILGILAAVAVPKFVQSKDKAENAARDATVRTLNGAVAMYLATDKPEADLKTSGITAFQAYGILVGAGVLQDTLVELNFVEDGKNKIEYDSTDMVFTALHLTE